MQSHISDRFTFDAPAEVVFGVLTDPDRITRWLPRGMRAESVRDGSVRVAIGSTTHEYAVEVVPGEMLLRWRASDGDGPRGSARVEDAPAGGSVVLADVELPGPDGESRSRELLAETMWHLERDVSDNFNAG